MFRWMLLKCLNLVQTTGEAEIGKSPRSDRPAARHAATEANRPFIDVAQASETFERDFFFLILLMSSFHCPTLDPWIDTTHIIVPGNLCNIEHWNL